MTITYEEYDTTPAGFLALLKTKILSNPHWSDQGVVGSTTTSTGATTSGGTTVNLTSAAGFTIGSFLVAGVGTANENSFQITNVVGNTVTISGTWGFAFPSGNTFKTKNTVLKSTSDRGALLMVDIEAWTTGLYYWGFQVYRGYTGTSPGGHTDGKGYQVWWRAGGGTSTMPIHVTLSVGKNHLFVAVEGPRGYEASPTNTTYGSIKTYFALSDLIPYHEEDTIPAVVAVSVQGWNPTVPGNGHQAQISRDSEDTVSWQAARLGTISWPTMFSSSYVTMPRNCTIDGNSYLFPYVVFSEAEGIRGRLSSFFYAGGTQMSTILDLSEPVGAKVTYDGIEYILVAVTKGDGTNDPWGPFGLTFASTAVMRSIVVAVPYAVAA